MWTNMPLRARRKWINRFLALGKDVPLHIFTDLRCIETESQISPFIQLIPHAHRVRSADLFLCDDAEMGHFIYLLNQLPQLKSLSLSASDEHAGTTMIFEKFSSLNTPSLTFVSLINLVVDWSSVPH